MAGEASAFVGGSPGPTGADRVILPMSSGVNILPNTSAQITSRPQNYAFRPERWTDPAAAAALERSGYRPWGISLHRCPGFLFPPAESKLLCVKLVSRYRVGVHELPTEWRNRPALLPAVGKFIISLTEREDD